MPEERLGRGGAVAVACAEQCCSRAPARTGAAGSARALRGHGAGREPTRFNVKAAADAAARIARRATQKFIVGREVDADPKVLDRLAADLGRGRGRGGADPRRAAELRDEGCALLVVSEELDELFEICDRLVVIAQGRVSPSIATARRRSR